MILWTAASRQTHRSFETRCQDRVAQTLNWLELALEYMSPTSTLTASICLPAWSGRNRAMAAVAPVTDRICEPAGTRGSNVANGTIGITGHHSYASSSPFSLGMWTHEF